MNDSNISLCYVEQLLTEFFSPETNNERKKSIEESLNGFSRQPTSWKSCLNFLSLTNNQFVCMFALSSLESFIESKWTVLPWEDTNYIRSTLYNLSLEHCDIPFVKNKLVKLVVQIAKFDWPDAYPDFFTNVVQLLRSKETCLLGLIYLKTASEDLMSPKEELPVHRKNELLHLFTSQLPHILDLLANILVDTVTSYNRSGTVTPPPSPRSGQTSEKCLILDVKVITSSQGELCIETLKVLTHLFTWIVVTDHVSSNFLELLFRCAICHDTMSSKQVEIAIQSMSTINEILYKPFSSNSSIKVLLLIFENGMQIFQKLEQLDIVDEVYIDKLTEFLQLFVTNHLKVVEPRSEFSTELLLEVLYQYTFRKGVSVKSYLRCLEIWNTILKIIPSKCTDIASIIAEQIFYKISFKHNALFLNNFDMDCIDENEETEWQSFLKCNIECISKVGSIQPVPVFTLLYQAWKEEYEVFGNFISGCANGQMITFNDENTITLCAHLRDIASLTQALARLSTLFLNDEIKFNFSLVDELILQTVNILIYTREYQLINLSILPKKISINIIEVYAQLLASLQAWSYWVLGKTEKDKAVLTQRFTESAIWIISNASVEKATCPTLLIHSAVHLFQTITAILQPNLWDNPVISELLCTHTYPNLKSDTVRVLRKALINAIILPNGDISKRHRLISIFVSTFAKLLESGLSQIPSDSNILISMTGLTEILEDCESSSTVIKKMLHVCFEPCINQALELLSFVLNHQIISEVVLGFLLASFSVLQHQIGPSFIQSSVQKILQLFVRENITGGPTLDKLLEILILIVSSPSSGFKAFLPSVTSLCLNHVWPAVNSNMSMHPDTTIVFLRLFYSILFHQWQYYFNMSITQKFDGSSGEESVQHKDELINILEIFGHALSQSDVNIFRQSLQSLEQLNCKWGLYKRDIFKKCLLHRFVTALFTTLLHRSHNLLADEIAMSIHSLASVDFQWFMGEFLIFFLTNCEGLNDTQRSLLLVNFDKSTDQPTMTRSVLRLVSDIRYYQICNMR